MRLLVFADSHTDVETMIAVTRAEAPDALIHLGDHIADGYRLRDAFPHIPAHLVRGNNDFDHDVEERIVACDGKRLLLVHGHRLYVDDHMEALTQRARDVHADIALFGHTHVPYVGYEDGVWLMNPGRIGRRSARQIHSTYGVIALRDDRIECAIREAGV